MPRSKRVQQIRLTKVKKNTRERKDNLFNNIRSLAAEAKHIYVIKFENIRTNYIQAVRQALKPGTIVFGKNRVIRKALEDESFVDAPKNIEEISAKLKGNRALLFTDESPEKIQKYFDEFTPAEFARGGFIADRTIDLEKGTEALSQFPGNMEVQIRKLGLPTLLREGVIHLMGNYKVCQEGKLMTPESAQMVKLLGIKMAVFQGIVEAVYDSAEGAVETFVEGEEDDEEFPIEEDDEEDME